MHTLRLGNNTFDRIPEAFYAMTSLLLFDAIGNRLAGTLAEDVQDLPLLTNVYLESNRLTGSLPSGLFHLKRLSYGASSVSCGGGLGGKGVPMAQKEQQRTRRNSPKIHSHSFVSTNNSANLIPNRTLHDSLPRVQPAHRHGARQPRQRDGAAGFEPARQPRARGAHPRVYGQPAAPPHLRRELCVGGWGL